MVNEYDGEDNNGGGHHENTPKTLVYDGLGRLIEVQDIETLWQVDSACTISVGRKGCYDKRASWGGSQSAHIWPRVAIADFGPVVTPHLTPRRTEE